MTLATKPREPEDAGAEATPGEAWRAAPLERRPGFLIRRLHQLHTALFARATQPEKVTPVMFSVLSALARLGPVDQTTLARAVAIDKSNMVDLLARLGRRGLLARRASPTDRRASLVSLTAEGRALLDRLDAAVERAHAETIADLEPHERALFVECMQRIVTAMEAREGAARAPGAAGEGNAGEAP